MRSRYCWATGTYSVFGRCGATQCVWLRFTRKVLMTHVMCFHASPRESVGVFSPFVPQGVETLPCGCGPAVVPTDLLHAAATSADRLGRLLGANTACLPSA
jgi:hypothetical protein